VLVERIIRIPVKVTTNFEAKHFSWPGDVALWPGDVALSCNPSYWEARIVGWLEVERSLNHKPTDSGAALWSLTSWCGRRTVAEST
jgi:hypothetical protein